MGWDFCLASAMFRSMILMAFSAIVPFLLVIQRRENCSMDIIGNFGGGAADQFDQRIQEFTHIARLRVGFSMRSVNVPANWRAALWAAAVPHHPQRSKYSTTLLQATCCGQECRTPAIFRIYSRRGFSSNAPVQNTR
jgi:hypothetical protein